jgi:hypothetical protein
MSIKEEYLKRAEECVRLAGACISVSNREILLYAAAHWRILAEDAAAVSASPDKAMTPTDRPHAAGRHVANG